MIKKLFTLFFMGLISITAVSQKKDDFKVRRISLELVSARRIPHNKITVNLEYIKRVYSMEVQSVPLKDELMWANTKIDTTFSLNKKSFEKIKSSIQKINPNVFFTDREYSFLGGYKATLKYGGFGGEVSYSFRTPSSRTRTRGLNTYMETCVLILNTAGFSNSQIKRFLSLGELPSLEVK